MLLRTKRIFSLVIMATMLCMASTTQVEAKTMWVKRPVKIKISKNKFYIPQWTKVTIKEKICYFKKSTKVQFLDEMVPLADKPQTTEKPKKHKKKKLPKRVKVKVGKKAGYVKIKNLTSRKPKYKTKVIPRNGMKSYMSYRTITSTGSPQYKMQRRKAYTDRETGVRMVKGRYCVAVGPKVATKVGTKIDLVFRSGKVVPAIVSDQKAGTIDGYRHPDMSAVEFVVDMSALPRSARRMGDMSVLKIFRGRVTRIRVYRK